MTVQQTESPTSEPGRYPVRAGHRVVIDLSGVAGPTGELNPLVMEVIEEYARKHGNKGYFWPNPHDFARDPALKAHAKWHGNVETTSYLGKVLSEGDREGGKSYCCGFTFEAFLKAFERFCAARGREARLKGIDSCRQLDRKLRSAWFVMGSVPAAQRGAPRAIVDNGLGGWVPSIHQARPGDFAQIFKDDHRAAGHAVIITEVDGDDFTTFSAEGWATTAKRRGGGKGLSYVKRKASRIHTLEIARVVVPD